MTDHRGIEAGLEDSLTHLSMAREAVRMVLGAGMPLVAIAFSFVALQILAGDTWSKVYAS